MSFITLAPGCLQKKIEAEDNLVDNLNALLKTRTAGDPDQEDTTFVELSAAEIARRVSSKDTPVSDKTVTSWFKQTGLGLRKMAKDIAGGSSPDREAQFDRIGELIEQYTAAGNPYFSVDTKAKERLGRQCYPEATSILLLCDCGGSNAANRYLFKHYLQMFSESIGLEVRVAHYPSYCSKYNPIERRFFPHVGRACSGMLFDNIETVVRLMRQASTLTGLRTTVNVMSKFYETGQKATDAIKNALRIQFDKLLPKWNYTATP